LGVTAINRSNYICYNTSQGAKLCCVFAPLQQMINVT
jgi:hypothetical protein